ncbi:MAG: L,D-transpeptidase family protein [Bacteroidales bacterium]|nr:L,D-transpeptidase family protein [Bacteroidales bacterium]
MRKQNKKPQKMDIDETILELDLPSQNKSKKSFLTIVGYFSIILVFIILSSYKSPTIRINNKLVLAKSSQLNDLLKTQINFLSINTTADTLQDINSQLNSLLIKFYKNRNYKPAWIQNYKTNHSFTSLLNLLDSSAYFGFPFDYFNIEKIHQLDFETKYLINNKDFLKQRMDLELTSTYSALKFMFYLKHGIVEKDTSFAFLTNIDSLPGILNNAVNQTNLKNEILSVQPDLVHHRNLLNSLSHFIDLHYSVKYTTPAFIDDKLLAKSLYYTGIIESLVFDSTNLKSNALNKLNPEFHLPNDSILNILTHESLVSLLEYRYLQTCLNLNRLRKLNHDGDNYLFINIPEFKLHLIEANKEKEVFNVIVGTKKTPTPNLTSNIEKVITNPYWTVPRSIVTNEMLRSIRKDSTYLKKNGFFVINNSEERVDDSIIDWNEQDPLRNKYWIRQINNQSNALGQVKFIFPNDYSVYLHDTQSKKLFKRNKRTFSHGCIRLENPEKLAQYLTEKCNNKNNIRNLISKKKRHVIDLSKKIKIHVQYITCSGAQNSDMIFFKDIYNKDKQEIKAIFPDQIEI